MSNTRKIRRPLPLLPPGLTIVEVRHDDDCPTLKTRRMDDCRCKPEMVVKRRPDVRVN